MNQIDLSNGYKMEVVERYENMTWRVLDPKGEDIISVEIRPPLQNLRWREWDPEREEPQFGYVSISGYSVKLLPTDIAALREALEVAEDFIAKLNKQAAPQLAEQESRRELVTERARKEREVQEEVRKTVKEELQNYVGQVFKLRRQGYKATVFGTIQNLSDSIMYTVSERGVPMRIVMADIEWLAIKWDGEKRYEKVYERKKVAV